ncbi:hypothetical protein FACS1894187_20910 [Synergistales bacterium]|nr:hypothetical protein FACS1894187_20910 [Synergistales bacterium]
MDSAQDVIHVIVSIHDPKGTYSRHAGVVMASIFENTKSPVCIHILHDRTLTEHNRCLLNETAEPYGQGVEFHDVSALMEQVSDGALQQARKGGHSIGALFRLLIPEALPIDKVIYLDSDIVVNLDIQELWEVSLEGRSLAGVLDERPRRSRLSAAAFSRKLMGCDRKCYINSGVLVMDISRIRAKYDLVRQSDQWYKQYRHYSQLVDQDFINSCFRGDIKFIDGRFNNGNARGDNGDNSILHAMGVAKPWNALVGSTIDHYYWKMWLKTPWGHLEPDEIVGLMLDVAKNSSYTHRHTSQCYKKVLSRLWKEIFCNDVVRLVGLCFKYLYLKLRT